MTLIVVAFVSLTTWQMIAERRRRAGTWYAVTDRRVLFVLTSVNPQSVVGIDFDELAQISLNSTAEIPGPLHAVVLKLKRIDPYMANSDVLGYQMAANAIVLEDVEDPRGFVDQIIAARLAGRNLLLPVSVKKSFILGSGTTGSFGSVALTLTPLSVPGKVQVLWAAKRTGIPIRMRTMAYAQEFLRAYVDAHPQYGFSVEITAVEVDYSRRNEPERVVNLALREALGRLELPPVPLYAPPDDPAALK